MTRRRQPLCSADFKRRFPVSEGFNVTVSYHEHRIVDATELLLPPALLQNP
ncbi:hypothetical protein [Ralstonia phage phiRSL1]|uniref:Uncharacterized protein n=1 Tax=Ralstonia phage phiRSL1 TaxID=1980924 RepID=B2ZYG4_9CAUD|nr:hypothetical protein RSL1_ORF316 [Ralstonia phage phiRSL1]BAG41763.1 hypothetical protein [Ralstonia phage phiRSL1]